VTNQIGQTDDTQNLEELYREADYWHVNTGETTIHAKRMPGRYRTLKWITMSVWLVFFLGPYLRWEGRQAIMWDIPNRKFHIFDITILPQDVWMLALLLLFFALLLAAVTSLAGRVFCGYFCFQTVWTDIFTWIEEKLEGSANKRMKLDQAPWTVAKLRIKVIKHAIWLLIGIITGISFTLWFGDAFKLWHAYFTLQAPLIAWATVGLFTFFTYLFAGHMREQVCFWLCPYARIQGVMVDRTTVLPTYDFARGEPRGKLKKGTEATPNKQGDCIDCKQCVAVCPTGIDIRRGQQEGCITCALCLDACDAVMDKIKRPLGLIRYASLDEVEGKPAPSFYKRPRVMVYFVTMVLALSGIVYGLINLPGIDLHVLHERQPLFVRLKDGSIQNKYELKVLNKTNQDIRVEITVSGPAALQSVGIDEPVALKQGDVSEHTVYLRLPAEDLHTDHVHVTFHLQSVTHPGLSTDYESNFFGPKP
jgi:cytochrome c oxidase accessory protein FixG